MEMLKQKQSIVSDYKNAQAEHENKKTKNLFNSLPEEKGQFLGVDLPLGFNSTESASAKAIAKSSIDSSMVNNIINVSSFLFKGAAGGILSFLGSTDAYGGQDPKLNQNFPMMSDNELKNMIKKDKKIEATQGMSKKEINEYDLMQKMKPKQGRNPNATYLSQN
tara:strand:+ start:392 stop:883 length:492 start_codon:yes stop_codon:yes gene_type:complete